MLIEKNLKDKRKSWYVCDMCGEKLTAINRKLVSINRNKKWDLCKKCLKKIEKYVED